MKISTSVGIFIKIASIILICAMSFSLTVGCALAIYIDKALDLTIDEELFSMIGSGTDTSLYYYERDNESGEMRARLLQNEKLYGGYRCVYADFDEIPKDLKNAFVSIEDKRFYTHKGVDIRRTLYAALNYLMGAESSFGGSTITQQLIKNVTDRDEYTINRKIQEIFWAFDLETKMNKDEILCMYLNVINLSQGCYGVGAAANCYFSKNVSELTLAECACIAAITNSPSYYDPIRNPENNKQRRELILSQMYEQGYIGEEEYYSAINSDLTFNYKGNEGSSHINSWYADMVVEDVINDLIVEKGYSRVMANMAVYTGGLKIYTAIDPEVQTILEDFYSQSWRFYSNSEGETPQSSMMIIDPDNGDILGVAGAVGKKSANRIQNYATQTVRPAGSAIKPLSVYAPAIEYGIVDWASVYDDVPVNFGDDEKTAWPKNSNGIYRGLTNINYAIENSVNTVTVRVLEELGLERSFDFLYDRLNMKSLVRSGSDANGGQITDVDVAALALGQFNYGVTVREITSAYSIFANKGIYNNSRSYYKVTDSYGSILLENKYEGKSVISEESASLMGMMLENVVNNGTAKSISLKSSVDCAGKTGTTQNNYDRWFIGYTPEYIGGVWFGYEYPKPLSGQNLCLDIWDGVMTRIHSRVKSRSGTDFEYSDGIVAAEYCADSGKLLTEACRRDARGSRSEIGYFKKGNAPSEYCDCHVLTLYDTSMGGVALFDMCPSVDVEYVGMIRADRSFPMQIYVSDAQYAYRELPIYVMPESAPSLPYFNNLLPEGRYAGISNANEQYNRLCRAHFNYLEWLDKKNRFE